MLHQTNHWELAMWVEWFALAGSQEFESLNQHLQREIFQVGYLHILEIELRQQRYF
jgi:hypothetical protein